MKRVLMIGGPGNISTSCMELLLERKLSVAIFTFPANDTPELRKRVKLYPGDRNEPAGLEQAIADFKPDAIVDFVCFTPWQARDAKRSAVGRVAQYVFISTVDIYGYPLSRLPMRVDDPISTHRSKYAADKFECERIFSSDSELGHLPLTIVRPSYSLGKSFVLSFLGRSGGVNLIHRLRARRPILVPGDGSTIMHTSCAYNTGRMVASVIGEARCVGKKYNGAHDSIMTHVDYVNTMAKACDAPEPLFAFVPSEVIVSIKRPEMENNLVAELTRYSIAFSIEEFRSQFPDFTWDMSVLEGMREFVAHQERTGALAKADERIIDDEIVEAWTKHRARFSFS